MSVYIAGFICALVLAALVVIWIAYCMFVRERHKSEFYQYNISDLQQRQIEEAQEKGEEKKEITTGIFILPSRRRQKDDEYDKRPDYPESPVHQIGTGTEKLIEIFNDNEVDLHYRDGITDSETNTAYQSDV